MPETIVRISLSTTVEDKGGKNRMFKKCFGFILAVLMVSTLSVTAFGANTVEMSDEYKQYVQLVDQGVLSGDITFEYWKQLKAESLALEEALASSSEFTLVYDSTTTTFATSSYSMEKGDVFITNGTSSAGILGHAAIAIDDVDILHIAGAGANPATLSLSKWHDNYTTKGWTKIYRHSNSDVAKAAGKWAADTYKGSSAEYFIDLDLTTTNKTYCSKLVWQAYYYGPDDPCADGPTWGVCLPYGLPDRIHDLRLVKTYDQI